MATARAAVSAVTVSVGGWFGLGVHRGAECDLPIYWEVGQQVNQEPQLGSSPLRSASNRDLTVYEGIFSLWWGKISSNFLPRETQVPQLRSTPPAPDRANQRCCVER